MTRKAFLGLLASASATAGITGKASVFPAEGLSEIRRKLECGEYTVNQVRSMFGLKPVLPEEDRSRWVAQMRRVEAW